MKNSSFSTQLSNSAGISPLQLAVDSTSLKAYKNCPQYYFNTIISGWQTKAENVHFAFGILMHSSLEHYHHGRARGMDHSQAMDFALDYALKATWNKALGRPWDSGDSYKNRLTLIRTLVWYLDKWENDTLETVILANGKPAVELSFSFDAGFASRVTGEPFLLCGHLDRLAVLNGTPYIPDLKTTKSELNARYWSGHALSTQFGIYMLAGEIVYKHPAKGLIVDGAQVLVNSSRFDRHLITKDHDQMDEFYRATKRWIGRMEDSAEELASGASPSEAYPMNEESCTKYSGCEFQSICARSPGSRAQWLATGFKNRIWDPLQRRGDI